MLVTQGTFVAFAVITHCPSNPHLNRLVRDALAQMQMHNCIHTVEASCHSRSPLAVEAIAVLPDLALTAACRPKRFDLTEKEIDRLSVRQLLCTHLLLPGELL